MAVQKSIELIGTGHTVEDAIAEALDRARASVEGLVSFEVRHISGALDGSGTVYQVELRVWFTLLERMHG